VKNGPPVGLGSLPFAGVVAALVSVAFTWSFWGFWNEGDAAPGLTLGIFKAIAVFAGILWAGALLALGAALLLHRRHRSPA